MSKRTFGTRLIVTQFAIGFLAVLMSVALPIANAARLPYPPTTTSKKERAQILSRYFPKDYINAAHMPEVTFDRLVEALERIEPHRPPVRASYADGLPQSLEIFDAAVPLEDKYIRLTQSSSRLVEGQLQVYNTTRSRATYLTIAIPEGLRAPDVTPEAAVDALAKFLLEKFPTKLVPSYRFAAVSGDWKNRMRARTELRSKFDRYVPAHFFSTDKVPDQTVAVLVKAFEELEPVRPPVGDDEPFKDWMGNVSIQLNEGDALDLQVTYERLFDVAGFNGPPPHEVKELTLPRTYRAGSPEQLREIKAFLMQHFPTKQVPTRELKRLTRDWTKRMIAEGYIAAPPSLVQRAKFYMFGRTCEALFR